MSYFNGQTYLTGGMEDFSDIYKSGKSDSIDYKQITISLFHSDSLRFNSNIYDAHAGVWQNFYTSYYCYKVD